MEDAELESAECALCVNRRKFDFDRRLFAKSDCFDANSGCIDHISSSHHTFTNTSARSNLRASHPDFQICRSKFSCAEFPCLSRGAHDLQK